MEHKNSGHEKCHMLRKREENGNAMTDLVLGKDDLFVLVEEIYGFFDTLYWDAALLRDCIESASQIEIFEHEKVP